MLLIAARWNAEIVAEKTGIIVASLIATMQFQRSDGGTGLTTEQLILVAVIFYALEFFTDVAFVLVMDRYLRVPILSTAINGGDIVTMSTLQDAAAMCFTFVAYGACIKMADMTPL